MLVEFLTVEVSRRTRMMEGRRTGSEEEARNVARGGIECDSTDSKSNHCDSHHDSDVPCSIVELARRDADAYADHAGDERRRSSQEQRDCCTETQRPDYGREELCFVSSCKMRLINKNGFMRHT